jgi:hypothetical protein
MPTTTRVAAHWGADKHRCMRCGARRPDRAHIVNRCDDGLDGPQNLWLLCPGCHAEMPSVGPQEVAYAWRWLRVDTDARQHAFMRLFAGPISFAVMLGCDFETAVYAAMDAERLAGDDELADLADALGLTATGALARWLPSLAFPIEDVA